MEKIVESFELYGKSYRLETGELAKQATGAVLVTQGETTCLVTAVVSKEQKDYDFFPLTVDFIEKMYAVGRIPGGYLKREAKPSDKGTLTARSRSTVPFVPASPTASSRKSRPWLPRLRATARTRPTAFAWAAPLPRFCAAAPRSTARRPACAIARNAETGEFIVIPDLCRAGDERPRAHHRWHQRLHLYGRSRRSGSF